jgi:F0F1-type ATP synthase assembly protein I
MANDDRDLLTRSAKNLQDTTKALQENAERAGPAAGAGYTLIGAIIVLGGIGYAIDYWRGGGHGFLVGGLLFGVVVGMWELAKTVWHK